MFYELIWFTCKEEITSSELIEALNEVYHIFWKKQPGFVKSSLLYDGERYLHAMCWETEEDIERCQMNIREYREKLAFFKILEPSSIKISISQVYSEWDNLVQS